MKKRKIMFALVVVLAIGSFVFIRQRTPEEPAAAAKQSEVVSIEADFKQYASAELLKTDADLVVTGTVLGSRVISEQQSASVSVDGSTIPALPRTLYQVKVKQVLKGKLTTNTITVSQLGGEKDGVTYEIEGFDTVGRNTEVVLFLTSGDKDIYYPLAGGLAVAKKESSAAYSLPAEVNGSKKIRLNANAQEL